jgi:Fe-S-cluster containining protein
MSKHEGCSCERCQECCRREPGWFAPSEIGLAARFEGLPETEFIAQFLAEQDAGGAVALSPARKPGSTECVFLTPEGLCAIHPVKPYECRKVFGCEGPARHRRLREIIKRMWQK